MDQLHQLDSFRAVCTNEEKFFILANKMDGKLGFFLLQLDIEKREPIHLIRWNSKLDIADCDMYCMTDVDGEEYVVVAFKTIGINTYNVFVFSLRDRLIKYWFEGYQLWESSIKGFLLANNDFLMLSKDGLCVIALGNTPSRIL